MHSGADRSVIPRPISRKIARGRVRRVKITYAAFVTRSLRIDPWTRRGDYDHSAIFINRHRFVEQRCFSPFCSSNYASRTFPERGGRTYVARSSATRSQKSNWKALVFPRARNTKTIFRYAGFNGQCLPFASRLCSSEALFRLNYRQSLLALLQTLFDVSLECI